jgi:hypothetical protein
MSAPLKTLENTGQTGIFPKNSAKAYWEPLNQRQSQNPANPRQLPALRAEVIGQSVGSDANPLSCYNSSIGKTRIKMQTFRIIAKNPSHENAASKLVLAAVRFFILAVLIRFKQHSAPPYETTFLPFFSSPLSTRGCAMI